MIEGLDNLSNIMGDRHIRPVKPQRHHARLCVNSAKTIVNFLYDTLDHRFAGKENVYQQLIRALDSELRLKSRDEIMVDKDINRIYARTDTNIRNLIKNELIDTFEIESFRESDIFFAALGFLQEEITPADVKRIFQKHKDNTQACGLRGFVEEAAERDTKLVNIEMKKFVDQ